MDVCGVVARRAVALALVILLARLLFPQPDVQAQALGSPSALPPELEKVRSALDKYQDPIMAVHDGYFSTLGCVAFPNAAGPGEVPSYTAGGEWESTSSTLH